MPDSDPFDLQRFVDAQADIYERALAELREGRKRSHWMWFMFPQIDGLGHSTMAQTYAIRSLAEARAYLAHPVLGARLQKCTEAVLAVAGKSAHAIFGSPDDLKFQSSMTLFAHSAPNESLFRAALVEYFDGQDDQNTTSRI
jgi:uncharacterized protein (DUF1810 family)